MKKVLVVDDEPGIRDVLAGLLRDEGYAVITTHAGRLALDMLREEKPDLVLLDLMMPVMDGHEVYRRMGEAPDLDAIPVIMMSAAISPEAVDARIAGFLRKPFDIDDLLATIERVLSSPKPS